VKTENLLSHTSIHFQFSLRKSPRYSNSKAHLMPLRGTKYISETRDLTFGCIDFG
jgi:hypothetical protein